MIEDAEQRQPGRFDKVFDVCVIGSGPAGVTVARRLGAKGLSVALMEAGGLTLTADSQNLYKGSEGGQPYFPLDACRLRYFGGTSNHWGGWTHKLDAYDFQPNENNPLSGWPITADDVAPYAAEVDDILNLPADRTPPNMFPEDQDSFEPLFFRFSRPITRFGGKYQAELTASKNVEVFVNANLVDMKLDGDKHNVVEAVFQSYQRPEKFSVKARTYALCLGALENPRALLNMTGDMPAGLGNDNDLVGRYFMEHLHAELGKVVFRKPLDWLLVYQPSQKFMKQNRSLNFGMRVGDQDQWNGGDFFGQMKPVPPCTTDFDTILKTVMAGQPSPCPGYVGDAFIVAEQALNPDSRVKLAGTKDRFGLRTMELDWNLSDTDFRTIKTCAMETGRIMAYYDVARLQIVDWIAQNKQPASLDQLAGGNHHMGTTRMSADPKTGVVDKDCKVHTVGNLYIGGSSVFSTSGHANPTYTITQLALRLGDHLAQVLKA